MRFIDRISGRDSDALPDQVVLGQWIAASGGETAGWHQNGCVLDSYAAVVPGPTGHWAISPIGADAPAKGRFATGALPDEQDISALVQLGAILDGDHATGNNWGHWAIRSPLAPGLDKALQPHPLERAIEREFEHLAAVCRDPRTHIKTETERVLVSRARRLDSRAAEWLSAHTEDWEHRKIAGVQPRRILAQIREEQWDLYENRVAVRLVDNLVAFLRRRIYEVERVLQNVFAKMESFQSSIGGNHRRNERICRLWGEAWDAKIGREAAERTVGRLYAILYRVLGLIDSALYKNLPLRGGVSPSLRITNLLSNDDHYRGVARLWREWVTLGAPKSLTQPELYDRHQCLVKGFDAWCVLLIVRALEQLRLKPVSVDSDTRIERGTKLRLSNGYQLEWRMDGVAELSNANDCALRIVPIVHGLENATRPKDIAETIAPLIQSAEGSPTWTVVLHPSVPAHSANLPLRTIANPPEPGTAGAIDFISVSPFSLDSVEKLARAIRWAVLPPRMMGYPPRLAMPPTELLPNLSPYLKRAGENNYWLKQMPSDKDTSATATLLASVRARLETLTTEQEQLERALFSAKGDPVRRSDLNRQKRDLLKPMEDAEQKLRIADAFSKSLATARGELIAIGECPVCGSASRINSREGESFEVECSSDGCGASWGLRVEAESRRRIPFLLASADATKEIVARSLDPDRVDEVFGCDVLAIPCFGEGRSLTYLPPRTDAVGDLKKLVQLENYDAVTESLSL